MAGREPITLPRPEGGAEHGVTWWARHGCAAARLYREGQDVEDFEEIDRVLFPVGLVGYEMPAGVPFEVVSTNPCDACNTYLRSMFMWKNAALILP